MDTSLAYLLLVVSLVVMAGELILPLSGFLFGLGLTGIIVALAILFHADATQGTIAFVVLAGLLTLLGPVTLRLWQHSPLGRRMTLATPPLQEADPRTKRREALIGRYGKTLSTLRPAGLADFDGERIDALSEGPFIESGVWVRCVAVREGRVIVRPTETPPNLLDVPPEELNF